MALEDVDWTTIPTPTDDGSADHLTGTALPAVGLGSTSETTIDLSTLEGTTVVYCYPMTGRPGVALPDGWDMIPGARGCTPQSCAFRDHFTELRDAGADAVYGVSTQETEYQREAVERLHLPFPLLSDAAHDLIGSLGLPTMTVEGSLLIRRLTIIVVDSTIEHVHYPVFPPDQDVTWVLNRLRKQNNTSGHDM